MMFRSLLTLAIVMILIACTTRKPTTHDPIIADYRNTNRAAVVTALESILIADSIPVLHADLQRGTIVTDSFEVLPHYCDCGVNFFGAEYPGTRRGQMRISVKSGAVVRIKFDFETLLTIDVNNKQLHCSSFGILESRLLEQLEKRLGTVRVNAQD